MSDTKSVHVLAFSPHPDDAEIFCGGLLAKMSRAGHRTAIVDLTRGELSSRGNLEIRARETTAASEALGLTYRGNLSFPDAAIDPVGSSHPEGSTHSQLELVVRTLRELRPELVLLPPAHTRHPDHAATHALVTKAIFYAGVTKFSADASHSPHTPLQVLFYQMRYEVTPSFIVDITESFDDKQRAIRAFKSQIGDASSPPKESPKETKEPETLLSSPLTLSAAEASSRHYGSMIGVEHGEPYLSPTALRIADPLLHFRTNPTNAALLFPRPQ